MAHIQQCYVDFHVRVHWKPSQNIQDAAENASAFLASRSQSGVVYTVKVRRGECPPTIYDLLVTIMHHMHHTPRSHLVPTSLQCAHAYLSMMAENIRPAPRLATVSVHVWEHIHVLISRVSGFIINGFHLY